MPFLQQPRHSHDNYQVLQVLKCQAELADVDNDVSSEQQNVPNSDAEE